jgi:hypothetical protein
VLEPFEIAFTTTHTKQEREAVALFHDFLKFFTANFDTFVTDAESK